MFRPNFGHDFGGYRDAIFLLHQKGIALERLVLMNDSVWYPIWSQSRLLRDLESVDADISGPIMTRRGEVVFLESYLLSVSARAYTSRVFLDFWKGLRLTSNKYKVIRRGERGFSVFCQRRGLKLAARWSNAEFFACAAKEPDLAEVLRDAVIHDDDLERLRKSALLPGIERTEQLRIIRKLLDRGHFYRTFPVFSVRFFNYPLLKKSGDKVSSSWRLAFRDAVIKGTLGTPQPAIWTEIGASLPSVSSNVK